MVAAIKEFQKARGGKPTGVLNPQERGVLADTARRKQENVGWKIVTEPGTGVRLGIPTKLVPQQASDANGAKWTSPTGTDPDPTDAAQGGQPRPPQSSPSGRRRSRPGATSTTPWSSRISSCCRACRA